MYKLTKVLLHIELGFSHSFLQGEDVRELIFGGKYQKRENHRPTLYT